MYKKISFEYTRLWGRLALPLDLVLELLTGYTLAKNIQDVVKELLIAEAGVYILPKNLIFFHVRILNILISFHVFTQECQFSGGCIVRIQILLQFCLRTFSKSRIYFL